jgi:cytochrome c
MSLELNKIAASVLTAGVVAMGTGFIADILIHPHVPEEPHYSVAVKADDGGAEPQEPAGPEPILPLLAEADPAAGEGSVRVCQACHSFEKGGPNKVGPNLYSLVGNQIAGVEGFSYSDALSGKEGEWTYEKLNHFLYDPQGWAPGTKMTYNGVKKVQDRANIVAYLRSLADEPAPLPTEEEIAAVTGGGEEEAAEGEAGKAEAETAESGAAAQGGDGGNGGDGIAAKIAAADPAAGQSGSRVCMA